MMHKVCECVRGVDEERYDGRERSDERRYDFLFSLASSFLLLLASYSTSSLAFSTSGQSERIPVQQLLIAQYPNLKIGEKSGYEVESNAGPSVSALWVTSHSRLPLPSTMVVRSNVPCTAEQRASARQRRREERRSEEKRNEKREKRRKEAREKKTEERRRSG